MVELCRGGKQLPEAFLCTLRQRCGGHGPKPHRAGRSQLSPGRDSSSAGAAVALTAASPTLFWPLRDLQVHGLLLPLILPSFYSELFTLYLLLHEREDGLYSRGITNLSLFPDTKLLEFLDVQE